VVTARVYWSILAATVSAALLLPRPPIACHAPISYRIGHVDTRFGLSEGDVRMAMEEAEGLWENAIGRNLFEHSSTAGLSIDFVFDSRQRATRAEQNLLPILAEAEAAHADAVQAYASLRHIYERELSVYEAAHALHRKRAQEYNAQIQGWDARGEVPLRVQQILADERGLLETRQAELIADWTELHEIAETLRSIVDDETALIETVAGRVESYQALERPNRAFAKGTYRGNDITIYQYNDRQDLVLVLAHELGHALGLSHVDDREAVMHGVLVERGRATPFLSDGDMRALMGACSP
jgi:hypothetical protein